ncbi:uncharacterized protein EMH_0079610 [Eimeria mitis]|uniref:Uncharacterized protein n=1 Tax=Eimeria mitis TaxID=44415 RepID=U6K5H5_9EIME|nr:uncharacterized protein EMH_0079610 [Eimeria mitis]CDJ33039.1 hypothetical protein EMH_0079610 [Eimeria mitis]
MASTAFELSLLTLARVGNASTTLKHENEDQLRILQSLEFVDECGADDFVKVYAAVAAMNYRMKTLERLSVLDGALMTYILQAHKAWLMGKLQFVRIPLEMDANLVQELHASLSKVRLVSAGQTPSGITNEEMQAVKDLFQQQYQDVQGMDDAKDVEAVKAASEHANQVNQRLKYMLQTHMKKFHSALKRQTLSKEEANAAAEAIAQIAESVVGDTEEFWRSAHELYVQIGGKPEDVLNFASGKALLQKLSTKIKSSTGEQVEGAVTAENVAADAVKKRFLEQWRAVEASARDHWLRAQETVEDARKVKKYKLDNERIAVQPQSVTFEYAQCDRRLDVPPGSRMFEGGRICRQLQWMLVRLHCHLLRLLLVLSVCTPALLLHLARAFVPTAGRLPLIPPQPFQRGRSFCSSSSNSSSSTSSSSNNTSIESSFPLRPCSSSSTPIGISFPLSNCSSVNIVLLLPSDQQQQQQQEGQQRRSQHF